MPSRYDWMHQQKTEFWEAWVLIQPGDKREPRPLFLFSYNTFLQTHVRRFLCRAFQWSQLKRWTVSDSEWNLHSITITDVNTMWFASGMRTYSTGGAARGKYIGPSLPSFFYFKWIRQMYKYLDTCVIQSGCVCGSRTFKNDLMRLWPSVSFANPAMLYTHFSYIWSQMRKGIDRFSTDT